MRDVPGMQALAYTASQEGVPQDVQQAIATSLQQAHEQYSSGLHQSEAQLRKTVIAALKSLPSL